MFGIGIIGLLIWIAKLLVGVSFFLGGIAQFFSREGKYDSDSTSTMNWSGVVGIILGAGLIVDAVIYNWIPLI